MSNLLETEEQKKERLRREFEEKNIQYYMVLATAWVNTKMEHDKTIITLSAGAIGLLITILTTKGVAVEWHIWLYCLAFSGYLSAIFIAVVIFQQNSVRIEKELRAEECHDNNLKRSDRLVIISFIIGTLAFISIGLLSATSKKGIEDKEKSQKVANCAVRRVIHRVTEKAADGGM